MRAIYQCAKIAQSLQRNFTCFGYIVFYSSLNVFNLLAVTKNLRTNYTFFVKSKCVF